MAIKKYSLKTQGNVYCSTHTQVKEMASIGQGRTYSDTVVVDTDLLEMVEKLFAKLNCKYYLISSGYRTPQHDKIVGGDGKGQHTLGKAVDACFYDRNGNAIPAKIVCCVAQDLGFTGIANISKNYRYVHLDIRAKGKYMGDEAVSAYTVTDNFYKYFGVSKSDVAKYTGEMLNVPLINNYPQYYGNTKSIVDALKSLNINSSFANRKKIAIANGITGYLGTASQNIKLLNLLKKGQLKKA